MKKFTTYIKKLGFSGEVKESIFIYPIDFPNQEFKISLPFLFYKDESSLYEYHNDVWNENKIDFFIAISNEKAYIIKAKEKPVKNKPLNKQKIIIDSFDYGTNTAGYEDIVPDNIPFTKEKIDNSLFFNFVLQRQKEIKNEIDKHLLDNLIALKKELLKVDNNNENINGLILKSLFVKYLEDREILKNETLINALITGNPKELENTFYKVSIINGDILQKDIPITKAHIKELNIFFKHDYKEYKETRQQTLFFPYKFDKIPIQLISNVYEEFIGKTDKKTKGIYYTRTFVVDFMLSHTIYPKLENNPYATILDPACGSGSFLVQAFKRILSKNKNLSIDEKAKLLKKQIFGIDIDQEALRITAFSLYLTLLEGIEKKQIQKQIEIKHPILPSLMGSNLLNKNSITDDIEFEVEIEENNKTNKYSFSTFDCIVTNPPWKELKESEEVNEKVKKIRKAVDNLDIYKNVWKYQTSQCFLLKINNWCKKNTDIAIIVNNSNFLNEGTKNFRTELLEKYRVLKFYELSDISTILFKSAKEPCAVLIMDKHNPEKHEIKYITPKLTDFSKMLRLIAFTSKDVKTIKQSDLKQEDILWRVFIKGNWKDYQLIKKIEFRKDKDTYINFCSGGIIYDNAQPRGEPIYKKKLEAKFLNQYYINESGLSDFNINQNFERGREGNFHNLFKGNRILIKRTPTISDKLRLICCQTENDYIFGQQVMSAKLNINELNKPITAILNSSLIGFFFNQTASQTNRASKIPAIKVNEIKNLPIIKLNRDRLNNLLSFIIHIENSIKKGLSITNILKEIDELVFDLYGLLEFEKEIIREFYQINVERKNDEVNDNDFELYAGKFREIYHRMIKDNLRLNAQYVKSANIGAIIKFSIVAQNNYQEVVKQGEFEERKILQLVKDKQISKQLLNGFINEEKVKIYNEKNFYLIKSRYFKDWTKRQAIEDANEEIKEIIKKLP